MPGQHHHHRAGALRQVNKKNKRSKASKRSLSRAAGGKVGTNKSSTGTSSLLQRQLAQSKTERRHHQDQLRQNKRQALLRQRRGGGAPVPRVVGIINLGASSNKNDNNDASSDPLEERVRQALVAESNHHVACPPDVESSKASPACTTVKFDAHKRDGYLTLLTCRTAFARHHDRPAAGDDDKSTQQKSSSSNPVLAALDLARIADVLLFVVDGNAPRPDEAPDFLLNLQVGGGDAQSVKSHKTSTTTGTTSLAQKYGHLIGDAGDAILTALKAQGLPTVVTALVQTTAADNTDNAPNADQMTARSAKSVHRAQHKRQLELKRFVSRFATTEFGTANDKVVEVNLSNDDSDSAAAEEAGGDDAMLDEAAAPSATASSASPRRSSTAAPASLVRTLCTVSCAPSRWVAQFPRPYLLAERHAYNPATNQLALTGYVRGKAPLHIHALVHVPGVGTAATHSITRQAAGVAPIVAAQRQAQGRRKPSEDNTSSNEDDATLVADAQQLPSLDMFATPDALAGEQNLIGFDEAQEEEEEEDMEDDKNDEQGVPRPAGWSDYQSAWLDALGGDDADSKGDDMDRGELAKALNQKREDQSDDHDDDVSMLAADDEKAYSEAERLFLQQQRRVQEQSEHAAFPDEVQAPEDRLASERFARYRALASFRQSPWDPKENLPPSYASLYHLASFQGTQRAVLHAVQDTVRAADRATVPFFGKSPPPPAATAGEEKDATMNDDDDASEDEYDPLEGCVPSGTYVTLTLSGVAPEAVRHLSPHSLLTAVALLEHENKISVLHMGLSCNSSNTSTAGSSDNNKGDDHQTTVTAATTATARPVIKSKDVLTFRCGWRTWQGRPVFSQVNLNCDKHKFERFMPNTTSGAYFAASLFGPVTYTPCPVLVFQGEQLVATGTLLNADANRIVIKRVILTGYPVRVHKRHATVKYMFHNPDDVAWFRPAELYSKHGLRGNIVESVGEHGTMKCLFNAPIKQHDTVCLPLYKRIYPKYADADGNEDKDGVRPRLVVK